VAAIEAMTAIPTDDPLFGKGSVRRDGRAIHGLWLFEVKAPAESKGPDDLDTTGATIPADRAVRPIEAGGCPFVKQVANGSLLLDGTGFGSRPVDRRLGRSYRHHTDISVV
jgi:branched-chain amino acid transport system substrate-binding protein